MAPIWKLLGPSPGLFGELEEEEGDESRGKDGMKIS